MGIKISVITSIYRGEKYIDGFFENFLEITNLNEVELVIIHNDPLNQEKTIISKYREKIPNIKIIEVSRENVYTSWNRGIQNSSGKYLAMWNIDDCRSKSSLEEQALVLDSDNDCMMVTGKYYKVFEYGEKEGYLKHCKLGKSFLNRTMSFTNGCFLMWRKTIHDLVGMFDEQFHVAGDWEFWMRVSSSFLVSKIDTPLGYYLRESATGISKIRAKETDVESDIIKYRYYRFNIANPFRVFNRVFLKKEYKIDEILNGQKFRKCHIKKGMNCISISLGFVFFWIHSFVKSLVEIKYRLLTKSS